MSVVDLQSAAKDRDNIKVLLDLMASLKNTYLFNKLGLIGEFAIRTVEDPRCIENMGVEVRSFDVVFETLPSLQSVLHFMTTLGQSRGMLTKEFMFIQQDFVIPFEYSPMTDEVSIRGVFESWTAWLNSFGLPSEQGHGQTMLFARAATAMFDLGLELVDYGIVPNHENRPYAAVFQRNDMRITIHVDAVPLILQHQQFRALCADTTTGE